MRWPARVGDPTSTLTSLLHCNSPQLQKQAAVCQKDASPLTARSFSITKKITTVCGPKRMYCTSLHYHCSAYESLRNSALPA